MTGASPIRTGVPLGTGQWKGGGNSIATIMRDVRASKQRAGVYSSCIGGCWLAGQGRAGECSVQCGSAAAAVQWTSLFGQWAADLHMTMQNNGSTQDQGSKYSVPEGT